jgi:uncharacterized hydrophobic protein (TIGR00271 family)
MSRLRRLYAAQDALLRLLGSEPEQRPALVTGMLRRDAREATSYWLQLVVSIGIATLGLVVGSTAVVIGAMLVAPLMGPIVALAMGLAAGSPFLVLRAAGRIGLSVAVAIGGAALITVLLPFHEMNAEITARASPTVLDLITAAFCALAGVYASLRPGSDTATTAAGTSIGISLVPPLCASGFGLGSGALSVAGGAALLFLTNLVAIIVVGTLSFLAAGFNRRGVRESESRELEEGTDAPMARALALRLSSLFESRWGPVLRFLMPFLLLAVVYVPLRSALDEVAWQVRVRAAVKAAIAREPRGLVESRVRVERQEVDVAVVLVGDMKQAEAAKQRIRAELRKVAGVEPNVEVVAVPDAKALAGLQSSLVAPSLKPLAMQTRPFRDELASSLSKVRLVIEQVWPRETAGELLSVDIQAAETEPLELRLTHFGEPLGRDALEALRRVLRAELEREIRPIDVTVPAIELDRTRGDLALVAAVTSGLRATRGIPGVNVCVTRPALPQPGSAPAERDLAGTLDILLTEHPRVTAIEGKEWKVQFVRGPCGPPALPGTSASSTPTPAETAPATALPAQVAPVRVPTTPLPRAPSASAP